jgi:ketosteroid isomerase-like protein
VAAGALLAADAKGDVAAEVERAVQAVQTAFNRGDVDAVRELLTADHVTLLSYAHFWNAADQLKVLSAFRFSEYKIDGLRVKALAGEVAQVTYRATIKGTYAGKAVPSPVHVGEVWVKRDGRWLQASYQETPQGSNEPADGQGRNADAHGSHEA